MTDTVDLTELKTREQVNAHYRQICPLLGAYDDVIREHQGPRVSINQPWPGGIEQHAAVREALTRIGRPARDEDDVKHALAYVEHMQDERSSLYPPVVRQIRDYVISEAWPTAGCVPTADEWQADDEADRAAFLDRLAEALPTDDLRRLLRETLGYAMPAILAHVSAEDADNRRRATVRGIS